MNSINLYLDAAFKQVEYCIATIGKMIESISVDQLEYRPLEGKRSLKELLSHLVIIGEADCLIAKGYSGEQMMVFYKGKQINSKAEMIKELERFIKYLKDYFYSLEEEELAEEFTTYWGEVYSRYEWFTQIIAHLHHHRAQVFDMMVQLGIEAEVTLFR
ncbi:DinB family protein [Mangrovibacillus cuniculi]|uniref:DinB family protein n=1 Tax=Mangrovibacillus cuniculi TaxID=2593652 RepID=A0A7S8C9I2_9BACI|nr:DinB family protein [Mangrovibacillus cuniculi]QPC45901.1 DinB family protein [Mangrovibacillus cuniculi]